MKLPKSMLDEMQERKLAKAESIGMHIAVVILMLIVFAQGILYGNVTEIVGEFIVVQVISVYMIVANFRIGVWDRFFKPGMMNHLSAALGAGVMVALFTYFLTVIHDIADVAEFTFVGFSIAFVSVFTCDLILEKLYRRRKKNLEGTPEQKELAAKVNVSSETIRAIEDGTYEPSIKLCREICRATGKTLDELFWKNEEN